MAFIKEPQLLHFPPYIIGIMDLSGDLSEHLPIMPSLYDSVLISRLTGQCLLTSVHETHESDFNAEFICNASDALFAQQSLRGPWGALSHFYMQMALHLGSSAGMLGTRLCKSNGCACAHTHTCQQPFSKERHIPVGMVMWEKDTDAVNA